MSFLAGNSGLRVSIPLQSRIFSIIRVKKIGAVWCLRSRDYGDGVPVRYIPKKSSKNIKPETGTAWPDKSLVDYASEMRLEGSDTYMVKNRERKVLKSNGLETLVTKSQAEKSQVDDEILRSSYAGNLSFEGAISHLKRGEGQMRNFMYEACVSFDDKHIPGNSFSELEEEASTDLDVADEVLMDGPDNVTEELEINQQENSVKDEVSEDGKSRKYAEELAIRLLATRAFTAVELRKKLRAGRFTSGIIESVINDFQQRGLINDGLYAETFTRSRWSSSCWGPRRIKHELFRKGVSQADMDKAIKLVFEDGDSCSNQSSRLSKGSLDHLYVQASKQWLQSQGASVDIRKSRVIRWLQYRGFGWNVISIMLKRLESNDSFERE